MPILTMFKEFKFDNGAQILPLFIDFVKFKPHQVFRMTAVSTCWRTSLINIRMAGMADLLPSYGVFFRFFFK